MDILYLLIPLSAVLVLGIIAVFAWALHNDQFDDLDREGLRILDSASTSTAAGAAPDTSALDAHQSAV